MIVYILLPNCTRSDHNVFFNILKNVVFRVGRVKLTEHYLDNAFKEGMLAKEDQIDFTGAETWSIHSSKRDKTLLWRLLGYWASRSCPLFGKILFGDSWKTTDSVGGFDDEIDNFVVQKMKCILVELNVSESTLLLLKHFVEVPVNEIGLENMIQISPKMKLYDVETNYWDKCWASLKCGKWLGTSDMEIGNSQSLQAQESQNQTLLSFESVTNHIPMNLARKRPFIYDMNELPTSQLVKPNETVVDSECSNVAPLDLSNKQTQQNGPRFIQQPISQSVKPNAPSMDIECNNDPLNLTSKHSRRIDEQPIVTNAMRRSTANEELNECVKVLQGELLLSLQRELSQKNSQLEERNDTLAEARRTIVALQLQLIEKTLSNQDLQRQVGEQISSLAEMEDTNRNMQIQLTAANKSVVELCDAAKKLKEDKDGLTEIESDLRSELTAKEELLKTSQQSNHALQLQLSTQIESSKSLQDSIIHITAEKEALSRMETALRVELEAKEESLKTSQQTNHALQLQLSTQIESSKSLNDSIIQITAEKETLIRVETALRVELAAKNDFQELSNNLQLQISLKNKTIAELEESINALQLQIIGKDKSLIELRELKDEIQDTIRSLESEMCQTRSLLSESELANRSLQLQLTQKNASFTELQNTVVASYNGTSEVTEMSDKMINRASKSEQRTTRDVVPTTFEDATKVPVGIDELSEATIADEVDDCSLQIQDFKSDDPIVRSWRERLLRYQFGWIRFKKYEKFRPGFVHPPDADGISKAQEINSDGYPSDEMMEFKTFKKDIANSLKMEVHVLKLKMLNEKFHFDFK